MVHIAVVEDDPASAQILVQCIERFSRERYSSEPFSSEHSDPTASAPTASDSSQAHIGSLTYTVFSDGAQLVEYYTHHPHAFDILLLDIEMPGLDGISTAKEVRQLDEDVIILFITNMAKYALSGYTVRARSYILKPISYASFSLELSSALKALDNKKAREGQTLLVKTQGALQRVRVADVTYIESQRHILFLHMTGQTTLRVRESMTHLEERLQDTSFARCGVSFLVNLAHVEGITREHDVLVDGARLPISRQKYKTFIQALNAHLGGSCD